MVCISRIVTYVHKLKEAFVPLFFLRKILSHFPKIHFHFPHICILQTCVKTGKYDIRKLGLGYGFDSPNM
jgi:hypothetical protein